MRCVCTSAGPAREVDSACHCSVSTTPMGGVDRHRVAAFGVHTRRSRIAHFQAEWCRDGRDNTNKLRHSRRSAAMAPGAPRSAAGVACTICSPLVDACRVLSCACVSQTCCDGHRVAILAPSSVHLRRGSWHAKHVLPPCDATREEDLRRMLRPCNIDPGAHTRRWERRSGVVIPTVPATRQPCRRTRSAPARRRVLFVVELFLNVHTPHLIDSFHFLLYGIALQRPSSASLLDRQHVHGRVPDIGWRFDTDSFGSLLSRRHMKVFPRQGISFLEAWHTTIQPLRDTRIRLSSASSAARDADRAVSSPAASHRGSECDAV